MTAQTFSKPSVFTIPSGWSFVDSLAKGLMSEAGDEPSKLAAMTVLLPTRRAGRSLREAFLRLSQGRPLLLPRMMSLGDMDDGELPIGGWGEAGPGGDAALVVPPAVSGLRRQLLLARLIMARPNNDATPEQAMFLAVELARLLDQVHTERLEFSKLEQLVPDTFAEHWRVTLEFLTILTELWPGLIAAESALDPADRRNRLLEARARQWQGAPPAGPVIAAGSTGSIPATADLLVTIARMPEGRVVLPGLDRDASDDAWDNLGPSHSQYGIAQLIRHLGVDRAEVLDWPMASSEAAPPERTTLINAALAPAKTNEKLPVFKKMAAEAVSGVTRIDCPGPSEEAAIIALMMRRNLRLAGRTTALVTPDRGLARRVAAELRRWDIEIDDSAGLPLTQTPTGAFLRLCISAVASDMEPVTLLALLKHPLSAVGSRPEDCRRQARRLERLALRGPRPSPGMDGLRAALQDLDLAQRGELPDYLDHLETALKPLTNAFTEGSAALADIVRAHMVSAEAMAATNKNPGAENLWSHEAGEMAAGLMHELEQAACAFPEIKPRHYSGLFEATMAGRFVRPRYGTHPRLFIWGLLEARLQRADLTILGGLNEGSWPPEVTTSPWMSRPMMEAFGLSLPERRIGLTAHDFVQCLGAPQVVLTRAERVAGTPTVPSRWLRLIDNQLERLDLSGVLQTHEPWLDWAEALDKPARPRPVSPPRPKPPLCARPTQLSVTRIETLIRDPYAIYASNILKLRPLDPLQADPGAAERGMIVHQALDEFIKAFPDDLPGDPERNLLEIGRGIFDSRLTRPGVRALWWPRFERIAKWFVENERRRRDQGFYTVATETAGKLEIADTCPAFVLNARADRIDHRADAGYAIIDYKTGAPPTAKQVEAGWNPQLPLEAVMVERDAFDELEAGPAAQLVYMRLSGGRVPGEERSLKLDLVEVVGDALAGVTKLIHKFADPATPYLSQPRPQFLNRFGDYDHLARVKEWRGRRQS